ncbi:MULTISPECIES: site-2 protease family protein [Anaeromyxobacter]|uniref:site-2 protease family protein n=1 Tax=Anaeromyxobacter TaxID=161492 RepID=UPI001F596D85|nr:MULTISPECIES: site-2 protease family protein [unclassified Anaeromyxobacter]
MARTGLEIGRVGGIRIRLDVTLLLALPFLAWMFARAVPELAGLAGVPPERLPGPRWAWGLALAAGLFVSVLLHELAHCFVLVRRGGKVRAITLMVIGGVTEVAEPLADMRAEARVAVAGPAASLALALLAAGLSAAALRAGAQPAAFALEALARVNVALGVFNLLPAFPMDGGRVLRAVLARRRSAAEATRIAANVGKAFAAFFAALGFAAGNPLLILVAFFVWAGAHAEEHDVLVRAMLGDLRVREIMTPSPSAVTSDETVFAVGERMLRERRVALPVIEGGRAAGFVRLEAVEKLPVEERRTTQVSAAMEPARVVAPGDRVVDVIAELQPRGNDHLAVADDGRLVGVVSSFDLARGLRLRQLAATQHPPPAKAG